MKFSQLKLIARRFADGTQNSPSNRQDLSWRCRKMTMWQELENCWSDWPLLLNFWVALLDHTLLPTWLVGKEVLVQEDWPGPQRKSRLHMHLDPWFQPMCCTWLIWRACKCSLCCHSTLHTAISLYWSILAPPISVAQLWHRALWLRHSSLTQLEEACLKTIIKMR